jgi:Zn-dependent peptidase ImmA (M78 family)
MKALERGFKAWAERTSLSLRKELGVGVEQPLPLKDLADYFGVRLWTPNDVPGVTDEVLTQLLEVAADDWSGIGLQVNGQGIVIYNPRHSAGRQASDITHELSHFILEHQPTRVFLSSDEELEQFWMRSYDEKQEDEANCLAWSLLLPRDGLIRCLFKRMNQSQIAEHFGVSNQLAAFRINSTGVKKQMRD